MHFLGPGRHAAPLPTIRWPWEGADSLEWTHLPTPAPYHSFDPQPDLR
jgi:hypothetical protein